MRNHSTYEKDFDLHENEPACRTHFHMKGFSLSLVLKQRHERTRKWPISTAVLNTFALQNRFISFACMITKFIDLLILDLWAPDWAVVCRARS